MESDLGPVLMDRKIYPPSYRHGRFLASEFLESGPGLVVLAGDDRLKDFAPTGALFLDTETTGLSGGT